MKTIFLKALIIDRDSSSGRALATLVKELFNRVQLEQSEAEIIKECQELKPRVIFINLGLSQRTENFELLEKLPLAGDTQTILFGYTDAHEPELVAHAIESGFHDIFVRPFDVDIIATKINKHFQYEKTQHRGIRYQNIRPSLIGKIEMPLRLVSVDENGLTFRTENYLSKGATFSMDHLLIQEIFEQPSMELMITRTWQGDTWGEHFLFAEPRVSSEKTSAALRRFILRKL